MGGYVGCWQHVRVVGGLGHVDMVVGVDGLLGATLTAKDLDSPVGDNLVDIHVALSSTASLEDDKRELVNELARDNLAVRVNICAL